VLGAVVISLSARWRRCSLCGVCYLSPWQRERRWVWRGPHIVRPGSMGVPDGVVGVCAEAFMVLRDRQSGLCSLKISVPWWRSSGDIGACSGLRSTWHIVVDDGAGVDSLLRFLSHMVAVGGVLCRVHLFLLWGLFVWWCMLRAVMYQCYFFLYDIAVLLL
jgi:hypothetical protein